MTKTQNISTPITSQSAKMHGATQKMLFLLFLPTENKRQILHPLPQSLHPPKCLLRFSSLWVRRTEEKRQGNQHQNWRLGAGLKMEGLLLKNTFHQKAKISSFTPQKCLVLWSYLRPSSILRSWLSEQTTGCVMASLCLEPWQNCLGMALAAVHHGKPDLIREVSPCRSIRSWCVWPGIRYRSSISASKRLWFSFILCLRFKKKSNKKPWKLKYTAFQWKL